MFLDGMVGITKPSVLKDINFSFKCEYNGTLETSMESGVGEVGKATLCSFEEKPTRIYGM